MGRLSSSRHKYWIIAIGAAVVLFFLALVVTPFLIDVNKFRPTLEAKASAALGRRVKLGYINLALLRGKLIADDIQIEDNPAYSKANFLSANSVEIGVEMLPLVFSRQLNVTGFIIDHPVISVLRGADGTYNFSDLGGGSHTPADVSKAGSGLQSISARKLIIEHGKLTLGQANSVVPSRVFDDFNIEISNFSATSEFPFKLTTNLPGGGNATLSGRAGPVNAQNIAGTPFEAAVKTTDTNIASYGFIDPKSGISGMGSSDITIKSNGNTQTVEGTLSATGMKFSAGGEPLPGVVSIRHRAEMNLQQDRLKIMQADLAIGSAIFHTTGEVDKLFDEETLNCEFATSSAPMDQVEALIRALNIKMPLGSRLQGGTMSAKLAITGTAAAPVASGPVQVANSTLAGFNLGQQLGSVAGFAGKEASSPDTHFSSLVFDLKASLAGFELNSMDMQIPSVGEAKGAGTISPDRLLDFKLTAYPSSGVAGKLTKMASSGGGAQGVPVTVTGTVEKPILTADAGSGAHMAGAAAKGVASSTAHSIGKIFGKKQK
jgi:AsmA protein